MKLFFGNNETIINPYRLQALHSYIPIDDLLNLGKLDDLNDLTIASPQDNQFIVYNSDSNVWQNKDPADALIALGITATTAELNLLDFSEQQGINTKFLKGDGSWSDVTAAGITGLTSNGTDTLSLDTNYKFSFEGTTSNDFETVLKAEDPTQDNIITLPNYSGEISLSPIQTIWYRGTTYTFSKNNEHVIFQGAGGDTPSDAPVYVILPNLSELYKKNLEWDVESSRGARLSFGRVTPGDAYIAPMLNNPPSNATPIQIDIIGDTDYTADYNGTYALQTGIVYYILTLGSTTQANWNIYAGLSGNNTRTFEAGDFFTAATTDSITGGGRVFKAIKIPAESFKSGCITITGTTVSNSSAASNYWIENPNLSNIDTTLTGTTSAALLNSTTLSTSTLELTANSKTITVKGPSALESNYTLNLPEDVPVENSVLRYASGGNFVWEEIKDDDEMGGETPSSIALASQASIQKYVKNAAENFWSSDESTAPAYTISDANTSVILDDSAWGKEVLIDFTFTNSRDFTKSISIFMPEANDVTRVGQKFWIRFTNINTSFTNTNNINLKNFRIFPNNNDPQLHSIYNANNSTNGYNNYHGIFNYSADTSIGAQIVLCANGFQSPYNYSKILQWSRLTTTQSQYNYSSGTYPLNSTELNLISIPTQGTNTAFWKGTTGMLPFSNEESLTFKVQLLGYYKTSPIHVQESSYQIRFRDTGNTNNIDNQQRLALTRIHYWRMSYS